MPSLPPTLASCMPRTRLLVQAGRVEDAVRWALVEEGGHWEAALALLRRLEAEESYRVGGAALNSGSLADKAGGSVMTASHSVLLGRPSPIRCLAVFYEMLGSAAQSRNQTVLSQLWGLLPESCSVLSVLYSVCPTPAPSSAPPVRAGPSLRASRSNPALSSLVTASMATERSAAGRHSMGRVPSASSRLRSGEEQGRPGLPLKARGASAGTLSEDDARAGTARAPPTVATAGNGVGQAAAVSGVGLPAASSPLAGGGAVLTGLIDGPRGDKPLGVPVFLERGDGPAEGVMPLSAVCPQIQRMLMRDVVQMRDMSQFWCASSRGKCEEGMLREWGAASTMPRSTWQTYKTAAPATTSTNTWTSSRNAW